MEKNIGYPKTAALYAAAGALPRNLYAGAVKLLSYLWYTEQVNREIVIDPADICNKIGLPPNKLELIIPRLEASGCFQRTGLNTWYVEYDLTFDELVEP